MLTTALSAPDRLAAIAATGLLDALAEETFDRFARLAARLLAAPIGTVTFVHPDRQYFVGLHGLPEPWCSQRSVPIDYSYCQFVVVSRAPLLVTDALRDSRVAGNRSTTELGIRAYAAVPLYSGSEILGALSVAASATRVWSEADIETLTDLSRAVATEIALRSATRAARAAREELHELLDGTTELVCATGTDGRISHVNKAWERALGYTLEEAVALPSDSLVAPEHRWAHRTAMQRLESGEDLSDLETVFVARDGHRVVCRGRAVGRLEQGRFLGVRAVYLDTTRERQATSVQKRLSATLEATSEFVSITSADGKVVFVNAAGRRLVGLPEDADVAKLPADAFYPPGAIAQIAREALPSAMAHGSWEGETELRTFDGEHIPVSAVIVAHPSSRRGEPPYFLSAVMRDLRGAKSAEAALKVSDARFRAALDASLDAFFIFGVERAGPEPDAPVSDFVFEELNDRGGALFGMPREDMVGQRVGELFPVISDGPVGALARDVASTGQPGEMEHRAMDPRTTAEWTWVQIVPVRNGRGMVTAVAVTARDITERKRAEAALRASELRFRGTLEQLRCVALALDLEGRVTFCNEHLLQLAGRTREEVLGADWCEWFVPEGGARKRFRAQLATGEVDPHLECDIVTTARGHRTIEWDNVVLRDEQGRVTGLASIGRDVTDARRAESLKSQLIATVSHELRTPLGAVRGALQLLSRQLPAYTEMQGRLFEMAVRNTDRLLRLANDLLDIERVESGEVPMDPTAVSIGSVIAAAIDGTRHAAESAKVSLVIANRASIEGVSAWADGDRISQVLVNLLANAVKFSHPGGTVTVSAETVGDEVRVSVRDQGRGIPADKLDSVFNRFEQVEASDARDKGGAGLGLAICRAIVGQHGGRIWAESTPGRGSTFIFTLPSAERGMRSAA